MRIIIIIFVIFIDGCSDGGSGSGGSENVGWVTITEPTTLETYIATDVTTINLAGESFISPAAKSEQRIWCDCIGWECLLYYGQYECHTYTYYDSGVNITLTNLTTSHIITNRLASQSGFISHWSIDEIYLAPNENVIQVRAADNLGNWGTDQITIYSVDTIPPTVLSTIPQNSTVASIDSAITVTFSEMIDTSTITTSSFTVSDGGSNITGTISFSDGGSVAIFTPSASLSYNTTYTVMLNDTIKDLAGNTLITTTSNFTTSLIPSPLNVQATAGDGQVLISWDALPAADYFNIYFDINPDVTTSSGTLISGITSTFYNHTGLTNGNYYYYIVTAVNTDGESPPSNITSVQAGVMIKQFGSVESETGQDIAVDTNGNSYVTGYTSGDLAGTGNSGLFDVFITKYDSSGNSLWIKQFGTSNNDIAEGIEVDENGNSYITGYTSGDLSTGKFGMDDVFIAKYDTSGNQLWIKQFGSSGTDRGHSIAVDTNGNSYITGYGSGLGTGYVGADDVFIAKYDTSGNQLWIKQFGTTVSDYGNGIAVDAIGNCYITGKTSGDITGTGTGNGGGEDVFITKYNTSGNQLWIKQFGSLFIDRGRGIAVDTSGNSYVLGDTYGGDLAGTGNSGLFDVFITKYDSSGNSLWIKQFGTASNDIAYGIAVDTNGNSYITGITDGDLASTGYADGRYVFIAKLDTSGNPLWIKQFGPGHAYGKGIAVDANSNSYLTGDTYFDLAGTGITGFNDVFIIYIYP